MENEALQWQPKSCDEEAVAPNVEKCRWKYGSTVSKDWAEENVMHPAPTFSFLTVGGRHEGNVGMDRKPFSFDDWHPVTVAQQNDDSGQKCHSIH